MDANIITYCIIIGSIAGFLGGMLGVGSGAVMVPAFFALFSHIGWDSLLAIKMAIGTSLASIILPSLIAILAQLKKENIYWPLVKVGTPFILLGSFSSSYVAELITTVILNALIGAFLLSAALVMLFHFSTLNEPRIPGRITTALGSFLAGLFASLVGIAGGNILVPTLMWFNIPLKKASATCCALGLATSLAGAIGFVSTGWTTSDLPLNSLGFVHLPTMAVTSIVMVICAPLGIAIAHKLSAQTFKKLFGTFLILVSGKMIYGFFIIQIIH